MILYVLCVLITVVVLMTGFSFNNGWINIGLLFNERNDIYIKKNVEWCIHSGINRKLNHRYFLVLIGSGTDAFLY